MAEPLIGRHPVEYFGHPYTSHSQQAMDDQDAQHCPFLGSECKKPRKSEPSIKVGVCTVGYKPEFSHDFMPVVVCPYRYELRGIIDTIADRYLGWNKSDLIQWATEVTLGSAGSVDYVVTKSKPSSPQQFDDFVCIEFQAAGTTGTPWEAVKDFQANRSFSQGSYKFGINWANEFAKTMMQQVYKKGSVVAPWNKRLVFILQDVGLEYLRTAYDVRDLHKPALDSDPVHFFTLHMAWDNANNQWTPKPAEVVSTDLEGIRKILAGSSSEDYITLEGFVSNIRRRLAG